MQYPAIFHFHECNNVFTTHFHHKKLKYLTLYINSAMGVKLIAHGRPTEVMHELDELRVDIEVYQKPSVFARKEEF